MYGGKPIGPGEGQPPNSYYMVKKAMDGLSHTVLSPFYCALFPYSDSLPQVLP